MNLLEKSKSLIIDATGGILSKFDKLPLFISPMGIVIEITRDCNLNCIMCPRNFSNDKTTNMTYDQFIYIVKQLPALRHITILGRGETLINPYVFDMLKTQGIYFTIVTNGFLLTEKNINKLGNVSHVVVSIDSPNKDTYKNIRGANLDILITNLKKLKKIRPDIKITIQSILMKFNMLELDGFLSLLKAIGTGCLSFVNLIAFNETLSYQHQINIENSIIRLKQIQKKADFEKIHLISTPLLPPRKCFTPWTTPRITIEGDVYPCCFIYNTSGDCWQEWCMGFKIDVPQLNYKLGNLFETPMKSILNSDSFVELRKVVRRANKSTLSVEQIKSLVSNINSSRFYYCNICFMRHNISC
ncbi:MAG: radical SAM protein [Nitrospirota bacterium]